tara:strand:+ start:1626 stop:2975 length:1350 start_codon:yes stop_codon:yes gene_type:complete
MNINPETSLLSICLNYPDLIPKIKTLVDGRMFADKRYREIYLSALELYERGSIVDGVTITEEIRKNSSSLKVFGEPDAIQNCFSDIKSAGHVQAGSFEEYSDIIVNRFRQSYAVKETRKTADLIKDGKDVFSVVEDLGEKVQEIERVSSKPFDSFIEIAESEVEQISKRADKGPVGMDEIFVPMAFNSIGRYIKGFRYGSLSLLGARPAMGKTTFAIALATDSARRGIKTLFISVEMNKAEITQKMFSHVTGIHFDKILEGYSFGDNDWKELAEALSKYKEDWSDNLFIDDTSETTGDVLRSINWAINEDIRYIIIDHLHELSFNERKSHISLTEAMGDYVKRLRNVAQRNKVALLALCQLNREVEKRASKIPLPSDLGESGALERIAHNVLFLYRDEVYNQASQHKGEVDVVIAKARGGNTGIATMDFDGGHNMVKDQSYSKEDYESN